MSNPFNWQGQPSTLGKSLQNDEVKRRNASSGKTLNTQARVFHHYQKAVPNVFTPKS
jgi:hypothetical protein